MSQRKLNQRQARRAKNSQEKKQQRARSTNRDLAQQTGSDLSSEQLGLVICRYSRHFEVEALEGEDKGKIHRCVTRTNLGNIVAGDKVIWRAAAELTGVIESRADRQSILERPDNFGRLKAVAANIDQMLIVIATEPQPQPNLIDRYLVAAELMQIDAAIILNKCDLIDSSNQRELERLLDSYQALGYQHCRVISSRHQQAQIEQLPDLIQGRTSIVVGQSGVGKSSLINTLLPHAKLEVGELSHHTGEGTHTTTHARLFHLPMGGKLIDSPGIRDFSLWHINIEQLAFGFVEFADLIGRCKYRNCQHQEEPGCAIHGELDKGSISHQRFESYQRIRDSIVVQQDQFGSSPTRNN